MLTYKIHAYKKRKHKIELEHTHIHTPLHTTRSTHKIQYSILHIHTVYYVQMQCKTALIYDAYNKELGTSWLLNPNIQCKHF